MDDFARRNRSQGPRRAHVTNTDAISPLESTSTGSSTCSAFGCRPARCDAVEVAVLGEPDGVLASGVGVVQQLSRFDGGALAVAIPPHDP